MTVLAASCHCAAVRFEVDAPDGGPQGLRRCNCSLCRRKGVVMATAALDQLRITAGAELLSLYQWNTRIARHYFCSRCGIYTHHQRRKAPDEYGYNVACLEGFDLSSIGEVEMTDGQELSLVAAPD